MKIKVFIIEKDGLARLRLVNLVKEVPELQVVGNFESIEDAIESANTIEPNVIFLDVEKNSFDEIKKFSFKTRPVIIFVTAKVEYALKAFEFFALDFLLKPYKDERFFTSAKKIINHFQQKNACPFEDKINTMLNQVKGDRIPLPIAVHRCQKMPVKLGNKVLFIDTDNIKYISASGYYAEIYTEERKYLLRESLSNLTKSLDPTKFIRIHRSTIINLSHISELISSNYGEVDVKMEDQKLFRVSKSYKKKFMATIGL